MAGAHEFRQHGFHARRRAEIISPLAQSETVGHEAADMAAQALGLSR
ncbi:helix-turn-helix domain-containing protein, partial [Escherichia coli]|nr:helix-turn-helix domain-containing protein [Escherichia coli]EEQ3974625.1 helix-turn-helix domain-containing protein [Escherichia coli]EEQ4036223.1 helix-turn-helix domain-containing protein [Escherichia coli]EEQ4098413.1 helix-turn-helix domain-containing protein [Escherichia coli]EEQ5005527.1 helix-turn-helix domain-containing protein [Escherichia coli]